MPDKEIVCNTCTKPFVFSEKEQAFFQSKGFLVDPKHCFDCRKKRRAEKEAREAQAGMPPTPSKMMRENEHPPMDAEEKRRRFGSKPRGGSGRGGRGGGSETWRTEFDDVWKKP